MTNSGSVHGVTAHDLKQIGAIIVAYASAEFYLNMAINTLDGGGMQTDSHGNTFFQPAKTASKISGMPGKVKKLQELANVRGDPKLSGHVADFASLIEQVRIPRNFLAHGTLGGPPPVFFSQKNGSHMQLREILACWPALVQAFNAAKATAEQAMATQPNAAQM